MRTLSRARAQAFYDRVGAKQDTQAFYEDIATDELVAHGDFEHAQHIFELGCGTGRFAERLLKISNAQYEGVDISTTMVELARGRLRQFGDRARVTQGDAWPENGIDRIVATYVLDLLPDDEIDRFLKRSAATMRPGGKLCIANLTFGNTLRTRLVTFGWRIVFRISPVLVGGCRPIRIAERLGSSWEIDHHKVVAAAGIASEVVVATRHGD